MMISHVHSPGQNLPSAALFHRCTVINSDLPTVDIGYSYTRHGPSTTDGVHLAITISPGLSGSSILKYTAILLFLMTFDPVIVLT